VDLPMHGLTALLLAAGLVMLGVFLAVLFGGLASAVKSPFQPGAGVTRAALAASLPSVLTGILGDLLFEQLDGGRDAVTAFQVAGVVSVIAGLAWGGYWIRVIRAQREPDA
jgi:hypothetical protein